MEKSGSGLKISLSYFGELGNTFMVYIYLNSLLRICIRDPGWKILDPRYGINSPDPQHWLPVSYLKVFKVWYSINRFWIRGRIQLRIRIMRLFGSVIVLKILGSPYQCCGTGTGTVGTVTF